MRKFILFTLILFIFAKPVSAHTFGQPPFLKINEQYANLYPVPLTSLYNFDLPQDLAPETYLINQSISFELDKTRLPAPPNIVEKTKFDWDFADGNHAQGLITQHKFSQIGSYIIKIYADDGTTPQPQMIESALINILPDQNYHLPQATILINGQETKDPLTDIKTADFKSIVNLDGSKSSAQNYITEYFWDFGDQKSGLGSIQTHKYPSDLSQVFVVLRVKDNNGFIADNFVEVQNSLNEQNSIASSTAVPTTPVKKSNQLPFALTGLATLIILLFIVRKRFLHWKLHKKLH